MGGIIRLVPSWTELKKARWKVNNKLWNSFEKNNSRWIKTKGLWKQIVSEKIIKSQRTKNLIYKEKSLK